MIRGGVRTLILIRFSPLWLTVNNCYGLVLPVNSATNTFTPKSPVCPRPTLVGTNDSIGFLVVPVYKMSRKTPYDELKHKSASYLY